MADKTLKERLADQWMVITAADYIQNVGWSLDLEPLIKIGIDAGLENDPEFNRLYDALKQGYDNHTLTWGKIYDLHNYLVKKIS